MSGRENGFKTIQRGLETMDVSPGVANWLTILERRVTEIEKRLWMDGTEWLDTPPPAAEHTEEEA